MYTTFDEGGEERIQRALNDAKRTDLADRFGLTFGEISGDLPAEVEAEFLANVESFEVQWAAGRTTTVREFAGNPDLKPPSELAPGSIIDELERALTILSSNSLYVDTLQDVPNEELYRFIVEELLDHEMNDIRVPGMDCHFIYEEFHPNAEYDAKLVAEWFIDRLFSHSEYVMHEFAKEGLLDSHGLPTDLDAIESTINAFRHDVAVILDSQVEIVGCTLDGNSATVQARASWRGFERMSMNETSAEGDALVRMVRADLGEWEIVQFCVPGIAGGKR